MATKLRVNTAKPAHLLLISADKSANFLFRNIFWLADFMIEQFVNGIIDKRLHELPITLRFKEDLMCAYAEYVSDDATANLQTFWDQIVHHENLFYQLSLTHRHIKKRSGVDYYYDLAEVQKELSRVSDIIYNLKLSGIFTAIHVALRDHGSISHYECMEILETLKTLHTIKYFNTDSIYDQLIPVFEDAVNSPDGRVSYFNFTTLLSAL